MDYRDFLPRGTGMVTRRPLILQLINGQTGKKKHNFGNLFLISQMNSLAILDLNHKCYRKKSVFTAMKIMILKTKNKIKCLLSSDRIW